ncbi:hypothetical protein J4453_03675 [Candidatus Woesearchaeota archaeon]|nr:hypothetical protein [Candidatus Woesearchaeota archaeon]
MDIPEKILSFIRLKGPSIPVQVAKEISHNILMGSAYLAELTSRKQLKVSSVKIGGSPLYFLPGQEAHLQNFSNNLNEKDKRTYDLLKEKKILRESEQDALVRVSLRAIKDFAVPLQVKHNGNSEIFWKWYLLPTAEAETLIKNIVEPAPAVALPVQELKAEEKKEVVPVQDTLLRENLPEKKKEKKPVLEKKPKKKKTISGDFLLLVSNFLSKNKIEVVEQNLHPKGNEAEGLIKVPSAVGELMYYYKAKNKQRINEGDLSATYIAAQEKKLPILFLTNGQLTKKAAEMLTAQFKNMQVRQL